LTLENKALQNLEKLKNLYAHKLTRQGKSINLASVVELLATEALEKHDPANKEVKSPPAAAAKLTRAEADKAQKLKIKEVERNEVESKEFGSKESESFKLQETALKNLTLQKSSERSRYISRPIKDQVWKRDQGRCNFQDPKTGKLCHSTFKLQYDHKVPFAKGGQTTTENLRLRCAGDNTWHAIEVFGIEKVRSLNLGVSSR
jgi:hypothetical protein